MSVERSSSNPHTSTPPKGVPIKTWEFLLDIMESKIYESLDAERRNMVGIYYGSQASASDLQKMLGYKSSNSVKYKILTGIDKLWTALPSEIQQKHDLSAVRRMKEGLSDLHRSRIAAVRKNKWATDQGFRDKMTEVIRANRKRWSQEHPAKPREKSDIPIGSEADRKRKSENAKAQWADRVIGARKLEAVKHRAPSTTVSDSLKKVWADPEYHEKMSQIRRKAWEDPDHRKNLTNGVQKGSRTPEARKKRSERSKAVWDNPKFKKQRIADMKKMWENEEFRERMLVLMLEGRTMPERKVKIDSVARSLSGLIATPTSILSEDFTHRIQVAIRRLRLPSVNIQEATSEIWLSIAEKTGKGGDLSDQELAELVGNRIADIINRQVKDRYTTASLDKPIDEKDRATTLGHVIGVEDNYLTRIVDDQLGKAMTSALESVEPLGRRLVYEVIIQEKPIGEVASTLKISVEEVQEELNQALTILRQNFLKK